MFSIELHPLFMNRLADEELAWTLKTRVGLIDVRFGNYQDAVVYFQRNYPEIVNVRAFVPDPPQRVRPRRESFSVRDAYNWRIEASKQPRSVR